MDEFRFQELERQRGREEYSRQVADVQPEYDKKAYWNALKIVRHSPCICGMCRQLIDEEIKITEKLI